MTNWRVPAGRHRTTAGIRLERWLAALATAIVVVALGGAVADSELSYDERFREFVSTAAMGEWVSSGTFAASVVAVRAAATITDGEGLELDTAGVWVLVQVRAMAEQKAEWIDYAVVRDSGGRTWSATGRIEQPLVDGGYRLDPRIPVEAEIAFEVPPEAATDLSLRLGQQNGIYGLQMASLVGFALPIDAATVAGGLAGTEPAEIEHPQIVIADPQILIGEPEPGDE